MSRQARTRVAFADTNLFIALLTGPSHSLHDEAVALFRRVADGDLELVVTPITVAELIYVSRPALGWSRTEAVAGLTDLLSAHGITLREPNAIATALQLYVRHGRLDFADAYLAAVALEASTAVASFDRDFDLVNGLDRIAA
ncbi:MAG: type II toxin-antitoxin system VapC family toxin [Actinomycetota bacterium]|nr:type II toxin-antitoxin system VapC family toxin [Actinomycetota bacterium]